MSSSSFSSVFNTISRFEPHPWQAELAGKERCENHLIRIPTGMGKTLGVIAAWYWHRVVQNDDRWPRRLVWCLPMRVLVEQTEHEIGSALGRLGSDINVHQIMGGADAGDWHLHPEDCAVLVGTQDMLLSAAMNRGYAAARARWPMDFGLLNHDCLWVMDEVQLMDVGLATSGQLQAFRDDDAQSHAQCRPAKTWWMSATLQKDWLTKSPDTAGMVQALDTTCVAPEKRTGALWGDVNKTCERAQADDKALAGLVADAHLARSNHEDGPTLVVVNTVKAAVDLHAKLRKNKALMRDDVELRLVHSRFRPPERQVWRAEFLNRDACSSGRNRIIVATQVIEAGVDLSAGLLITQLAPWPSLVQRFGRCARWGGSARVIVADHQPSSDKAALPYTLDALDAARGAVAQCPDVAPIHLEAFEDAATQETIAELYPYDPKHLLLRYEIDELFDTTPDLSGADIDISRFIRSGDERDVQVFWERIDDKQPDGRLKPTRDALCSVPFLEARRWLCGSDKATQSKVADGKRAWVWDWLDKQWTPLRAADIYPGQTVCVSSDSGGYDPEAGFAPKSGAAVEPVERQDDQYETVKGWVRNRATGGIDVVERQRLHRARQSLADSAEDDETLSEAPWETIATHGRRVSEQADQITSAVVPGQAKLFNLAARWHDLGKAHAAFGACIRAVDKPHRPDLAKAPDRAWPHSVKQLYRLEDGSRRPGFRHELASTLALFDVLRRHAPMHPALLGPWQALLDKMGTPADTSRQTDGAPTPIEQEIMALSAPDFDLLAYLVCSHHGKVRMSWHHSPADQKAKDTALRIRGVRQGDMLPATLLATADGTTTELPACLLHLAPAAMGLSNVAGASWTERVLALQEHHGTFRLAWLEALLRAADIRASQQQSSIKALADPLLSKDNVKHDVATDNSTVASTARAGQGAPALGEHPGQRGRQHGVRAGAGGPGTAGSSTQTPAHATRYIDTTKGRLSYLELAPNLAQSVQGVEEQIAAGAFDGAAITPELIANLHTAICEPWVPQFCGWRDRDVAVGTHEPPPFTQVPEHMHRWAHDLEAQLQVLSTAPPERLLETLAFAEGRLLSIHPFTDFNGRVTRVFLRLLLRRLDLPVVQLAAAPGEATQTYLAALRAGDQLNWQPLMQVWQHRFEHAQLPEAQA